jgi:biopolymer transport protein ExbB
MKFIDLMITGGVMMWPILFCSVTVLAVLIDRAWYFSTRVHMDVDGILCSVVALVKQGSYDEALALLAKSDSPAHNILRAVLEQRGMSKSFIKEKAEEVSLIEVPKMERNLSFLSSIAQVAPLMGLLGTVFGIITAFGAIETKSSDTGAVSPADLAGGIKEALYATAFGLLVAIPAYVIYHFYANKINAHVTELERCAAELLLQMEKQGLVAA